MDITFHIPRQINENEAEYYAILESILDYVKKFSMPGVIVLSNKTMGDKLNLMVQAVGNPYRLLSWYDDGKIVVVFNRDPKELNPVRSHFLELADPQCLYLLQNIIDDYLNIPRLLNSKAMLRFTQHLNASGEIRTR